MEDPHRTLVRTSLLVAVAATALLVTLASADTTDDADRTAFETGAVGPALSQRHVWLSQVRSVSAEATASSMEGRDSDSDLDEALDFELFESEVSVSASSGSGHANADVSQRSDFTASSLAGTGVGRADAGGSLFDAAQGEGTGESFLEVTFVIADDTPFTAGGSVVVDFELGSELSSFASFTLTGPDEVIFTRIAEFDWNSCLPPGCRLDFDEAGTLAPGQYILTAVAHVSALGGPGGSAYGQTTFDFQFDLILPCFGDLDGSGAVDFGDILAVLAAWGDEGGPEDLDESGVVDFGDILAVLTAWGACS